MFKELKHSDPKLNKERYQIFTETLRLIEEFDKMKLKDYFKEENAQNKLWEYFGRNIGYYWN